MAKRSRRIAIVSLSIVAIGFAGYYVWYGITARQLTNEWAAAEKLGLVKTSSELNGPPLPDSENAAPEFLAALREFEKVPDREIQLLWRDPVNAQPEMKGVTSKPYVSLTRPEFERVSAALAPAIEHLTRGAARRSYYVEQDWEQPWDSLLGGTSRPANALVRIAYWKAYFGDLDAALADLAIVRRVAGIAERRPYLHHQLIGFRLERATTHYALMIAYFHRKDGAAIAKLRSFLEVEPTPFEFADSMAVEAKSMSWGVRMLGEDPRKIGLKDDDLTLFQVPLRLAAYNQSEQAKVVRICRETYERYHGMGRDFVAMLKKLSETDPKKAARWQWNDERNSYYPSLDFTYQIQVGASAQVRRELSLVALDVIETYGRTGAFPKELPKGPHWIDPFSAKPFRFAMDKGRFRLFSVGIDGKNGSLDSFTNKPAYENCWSVLVPSLEDPVPL